MKKAGLLAVVFIALVSYGCSSLAPRVVEKSGSKEKWAKSENNYFLEDDALYFRGEVSGVHDLALGKRQAEADAKKRIVEAVSSELTSEYREFIRGANDQPGDVGRFVEDAIETVSSSVNVSGMLAEKTYWERFVERSDKEGKKPYFHIYALVKIEKAEFDSAKSRVIDRLIARVRADKNNEAEQMVEEWRKRRGGQPSNKE